MAQPLNQLAPFYVKFEEVGILQVDASGVFVNSLSFPDGTSMTSAVVSDTVAFPDDVDCGLF